MQLTVFDIKLRIINKLVRWGKWGGAHTENMIRGLPSHLRGEKITKQAIRELVRDGWIVPILKTHETHYHLNSKKAKEIKQFYEKGTNPI